MGRSYNSAGNVKIDDLTIGLCPVCNRRLSADCEHRTMKSEQAYAVFLAAEQMNANENWVISDAASDVSWQTDAELDAADYYDLKAMQESCIHDGVSSPAWWERIEPIEF